jgi:hypothetical protein
MKKLIFAAAVATSAMLGFGAQAAPASSTISGVAGQVTTDAQKVYHCRHWSGGWHCGGGGGWGGGGWGHSRYWSHRRHGSRGW